MPNVAIVGFDTYGALCLPSQSQLIVNLQNFAEEAQTVELLAVQEGRRVAEATARLEPRLRSAVSLALPSSLHGPVEVRIHPSRDALAADNEGFLLIHEVERIPIAVISDRPQFLGTVGTWLDACPRLSWTAGAPEPSGSSVAPSVIVTDEPLRHDLGGGGVIRFARAASGAQPQLVHWLLPSPPHPIGAYLAAIEPLTATVAPFVETAPAGEPIFLGIAQGRTIPLVQLKTHGGERVVEIAVDPTTTPRESALLIVFLNSLRWLLRASDSVTTGTPFLLPYVEAGALKLQRPDGPTLTLAHDGGPWRYEETSRAGWYRLTSRQGERILAANFLDPIESDLLKRRSTWKAPSQEVARRQGVSQPSRPVAHLVLLAILWLLAIEWLAYGIRSLRRRR
jgi:hypothetical protein